MPKLYRGITQPVGRGRYFVFFLTSVFFPFFLLAQPSITSFAPLSGPTGTTVTITGSNFSATPSANIVYFGAAKATVSAASATSLTVTVPTGASYEPLTVTTGGLTAYSTKLFNGTFSDPGQFTPTAFATPQPVTTGATTPVAVCAKDLDGDGKTDLAAIGGTDLLIYSNASIPGFPQFNQLPSYTPDITDNPVTIAVGDLDGDGKPDLVVSMNNTPTIYAYLNTSTPGNISFSQTPVSISASVNTINMVIADVNGDGKPDIAATSEVVTNDAYVYTNASTPGNISFPTRTNLPMASAWPGMIVVADLDGDGMPDIACAEFNSYQVYLFQNTGTRGGPVSFSAATPVSTGVDDAMGNQAGPFGLAAADLDGDGKMDLVTGIQYQNKLLLLRNTSSTGNISFIQEAATPAAVPVSGDIVISDLDGDGLPDVSVVASEASDSVFVYRNTSTSGHIDLAPYVSYLANTSASWLTAADLDGDGMPELSVANSGQTYVSVLINKKADDLSITSFTPTNGVTGTTVTITGTKFTGVTVVSFGGVNAAITSVTPTTITAVVGAGASGFVKVTTPTGFAAKDGFTFNIQAQTITNFSPQTGDSTTVVLIEGTGFLTNGVTGVSFGGTNAASFAILSDTEISAVVGQGSTGSVRVISPANTVASSDNFIYNTTIPTGPPLVTSLSPMSATQGTDITISGSNFSNITGVTFGGVPAQSYKVYSDNIIHAIVAGGATGDVSVTDSNGTGSYPGFTFLIAPPPAAPPKITGFSPQSASSGTQVNITGINLSDVTTITFGGSLVASIIPVSDTHIIAVVGTGATGQVRVASAAGADSLNGFTYIVDTTTQTAPTSGVFQLVQFSGAINNNQPRLNWQVRNDGAISYYAVERSIDGSQFNVIGTVPVSNKTGTGHNYTFSDLSPRNGVNYYRLKMQDTTTHFVYSSSIALQLSGGAVPLLSIYPNPVKYGFFLVDLPAAANASIFRLSDFSGRIVKTMSVPAGVPQVRINVPGLPRGTYQLYWTDGTRTAYQTILVL
ncbi:MAG TPA: FG-GAP-like repeat-containing protein [Puia sp.]